MINYWDASPGPWWHGRWGRELGALPLLGFYVVLPLFFAIRRDCGDALACRKGAQRHDDTGAESGAISGLGDL